MNSQDSKRLESERQFVRWQAECSDPAAVAAVAGGLDDTGLEFVGVAASSAFGLSLHLVG